jgi:hypothetical protein
MGGAAQPAISPLPFFVSRAGTDRVRALRIARNHQSAGHTTTLEDDHLRPAMNAVREIMRTAAPL